MGCSSSVPEAKKPGKAKQATAATPKTKSPATRRAARRGASNGKKAPTTERAEEPSVTPRGTPPAPPPAPPKELPEHSESLPCAHTYVRTPPVAFHNSESPSTSVIGIDANPTYSVPLKKKRRPRRVPAPFKQEVEAEKVDIDAIRAYLPNSPSAPPASQCWSPSNKRGPADDEKLPHNQTHVRTPPAVFRNSELQSDALIEISDYGDSDGYVTPNLLHLSSCRSDADANPLDELFFNALDVCV